MGRVGSLSRAAAWPDEEVRNGHRHRGRRRLTEGGREAARRRAASSATHTYPSTGEARALPRSAGNRGSQTVNWNYGGTARRVLELASDSESWHRVLSEICTLRDGAD
eukprot:scaffold15111_cov36-Phaeocystis_antarctica.AAC.3